MDLLLNFDEINKNTQRDVVIWDVRQKDHIARLKFRQIPHIVEQLLIADVAVSDKICFEIKKVTMDCNDVKASLIDGDDRIHQQSDVRRKNYPIHGIIFQNEIGPAMFDHILTPDVFRSLVNTQQWIFGSQIIFTKSDDETIDFIQSVYNHIRKRPDYVSPCNKQPKPKTLYEQRMYFLSGLIDVGDKKAIELLAEFSNPYNIMEWIVGEIGRDIKGFGPKFFEKNRQMLIGDKKNERN